MPMHPNTAAGLALANSQAQRRAANGLIYARAWRARNKPYFDAIYGQEQA